MLSSFIPICVAAGLLAFFWYGFVRPFGVERDPETERRARNFVRLERAMDNSNGMIRMREAMEMPMRVRREYEGLARRLDSQYRTVEFNGRAAGVTTRSQHMFRSIQRGFAAAGASVADFGAAVDQVFSRNDYDDLSQTRPRRRRKPSPVEAWNS